MSASRTSRNSRNSRYLRPPWNSFVDAEDVAEARSFISAKATLYPRPAASRAIPQPFMPPPMMKISTLLALAGTPKKIGILGKQLEQKLDRPTPTTKKGFFVIRAMN